jgi:hypothetical protein
MSWLRRFRALRPPPRRRDDAHGAAAHHAPTAAPSAGPGVVPDHVVVYLHIPKCGGTSLHEWMTEVLAPGVLSPERNRMPADLPPERIESFREHRVFSGHFDLVDAAHFPGPQHRFTVLRDPVERLVSLYDYWRAYDSAHVEAHDLTGPRLAAAMSFEEFVGSPHPAIVHDVDNTIVRTFTGLIRTSDPIDDPERALSDAIVEVGRLDHVGHVADLGTTANWLRREFGMPPAPPAQALPRRNAHGSWTEPYLRDVERTIVTDAARAAVEPLVRLDRELVARFAP